MRLAVGPFSIICSKIRKVRQIGVGNLDSPLAMPHSILELSQIIIFSRKVFKAKAVLISLTGQLCLPLSKVKDTIKVPYNIFVGFQLKVNSVSETSNDEHIFALVDVYIEESVYVLGDLLVLLKIICFLWYFQGKSLWDLQFLGDLISEVIIYASYLPLWLELKDLFLMLLELFGLGFLFELRIVEAKIQLSFLFSDITVIMTHVSSFGLSQAITSRCLAYVLSLLLLLPIGHFLGIILQIRKFHVFSILSPFIVG